MKCPKCQSDNPESAKFCNECGNKLETICPSCGKVNPPGCNFCNECDQKLEEDVFGTKEPCLEGERKQVTVLFSDLSGYTAMSERLDPEEVKEIMSQVFGEITSIVNKYDGSIEKFIGDAVVAFFGVPKTHEDDPVRAIRVVKEIHSFVEGISKQVEQKTGQSLSMHTGINTGLVVTGQVDQDGGTTGVLGDTINLASRLSGLAKPDEILVGAVTHQLAEGHFIFERLEPVQVKGKAKTVQAYRLLSIREKPFTLHGTFGLRADFIGRKAELVQLQEAVQELRQGQGGVFSLCGDAGTGKTRLLEEFRATLDPSEIQWREGHAYAYSQNIPYFPLIDLLNRTWHIKEGDPPETVREKVELNIGRLIGKKGDVAPYIGSLYSLNYPEIEGVSPEFWRSGFIKAIQAILSALTQSGPTVICLEDVHWADPSTLDLVRSLVSELTNHLILFISVYRLPFSLFTSHQLGALGTAYREIKLQDLSASDAQDMMESLLKSKTIPHELERFIHETVQGNPFYLEEVINALIDSGALTRDNGTWKLTQSIVRSEIPSTVQGVISARLDRLEKEMKRVLQEASVIGRAFLYQILKEVTQLREHLDRCLSGLERLDLIRMRSLEPDLEYIFKHALTQEVVYNGLLKKERREIHEHTARVMEKLFQDRLSEFFETLAFHFAQGQSVHKAVDYLVKSGEKSLERYAVEESHQYYKEGFELLSNKPDKTKDEEALLVDLFIKWALVFYYRGDFKGIVDLFVDHVGLAESLDDKARLGMFYAWLGWGFYGIGKPTDAYGYLTKALAIGEEIDDQHIRGYACCWLTWTCAELGHMDEAIAFGEKAWQISSLFESDPYLYFKSLGGIGHADMYKGEKKRNFEIGQTLIEYGRKHSNIRCLVVGHICMGYGHFAAVDFESAIKSFKSAMEVSADPFYSQWPRAFLGMSYLLWGQMQEAEEALHEVLSYCQNLSCGVLQPLACAFLGVISIAKGHMSKGLAMIEGELQTVLDNNREYSHGMMEYILGKVFLNITERAGPMSLSTMAKNAGFLIKNVPFASERAEGHFIRAIEVAKEIGAKGTMGMAYLDLGLLYRTKGKTEEAKRCISEAIKIFEQTEAEGFLKKAHEELASLKGKK
jgi:class 3 adenylate cyclase/tetratricopeptide (TPR) repeat protein